MSISDFFSLWWMAGIVLPIFFTVVVGGLVNLWSGFVTADLITFRAIMREATEYMRKARIEYDPARRGTRIVERHGRIDQFERDLIALGQQRAARELHEHAWAFFEITEARSITQRLMIASIDALPAELTRDIEDTERILNRVRAIHPHYLDMFVTRFFSILDYREEKNRHKIY
jgi:hypothetical protein